MEFWRLVAKPLRQRSLVTKLMRDLDSGQFKVPASYDILSRYRTEQLCLDGKFALKVSLPEKPLVREFLRRYPEARSEPVALDSFRPPLARQFAQRQLQLMQSGADRAGAFRQVEQEFATQLAALRSRQLAAAGALDLLQRQEQEALEEGAGHVAQLRGGAGPGGSERAG